MSLISSVRRVRIPSPLPTFLTCSCTPRLLAGMPFVVGFNKNILEILLIQLGQVGPVVFSNVGENNSPTTFLLDTTNDEPLSISLIGFSLARSKN